MLTYEPIPNITFITARENLFGQCSTDMNETSLNLFVNTISLINQKVFT